MAEAAVLVCIIVYIAFRNWLHHDNRRMLHRERMAAIEKGIELPALTQEAERKSWSVQRFLLLAGVSWIFIAMGAFIGLTVILGGSGPGPLPDGLPSRGLQFVSIIPLGIGIAHLITFWAGERREKQ